jgi:hypothetical protein
VSNRIARRNAPNNDATCADAGIRQFSALIDSLSARV